jgi:hypothetical protein
MLDHDYCNKELLINGLPIKQLRLGFAQAELFLLPFLLRNAHGRR